MSSVVGDAPPIGNLELRHLHALRAVAEEGSFGRAAERLGYTQSAISQQVAALERAIGQPVFDRPGGPRRVTLTEAGSLLLERSGEILDRVAVTLADLAQLRSGERGTVRLGTFQSVSVSLVPRIMGRMRERWPLVEIELHELDDDDELEQGLLAGRLDLTFTVTGPDVEHPGIEFRELFSDPYLVLTPAGEPEGPFRAAALAERPVIGSHDSICERIVDEGLAAHGIQPAYAFRTGDNAAVHAMVRNGMGVAVMPRLAIDASDPTTTAREIDLDIPDRHVVIAWRAGTPGPLTARVVEVAAEVVGELGLAAG